MLNVISVISLCSFLVFGSALLLLIVNRRKTGMTVGEFVPLFVTIGLFVFISLSNFLEHSALTAFFDPAEDVAEILALPFCMFFLSNWHQQRSMDALREKEAWLQITFDSIPDGVMCTDQAGKVLMLNSAMEKLTGWTRQEAFGQRADDILSFRDKKNEEPFGYSPFTVTLSGNSALDGLEGLLIESRNKTVVPVSEKNSAIRGKD